MPAIASSKHAEARSKKMILTLGLGIALWLLQESLSQSPE